MSCHSEIIKHFLIRYLSKICIAVTYLAISAAICPFKSTILGFAPLAIKSST
jgi:hypothetical protein